MSDERYDLLARTLVEFSVDLQSGERVLVNNIDVPDDMTIALLRAIRDRGGVPILSLQSNKISLIQSKIFEEETFNSICEIKLDEMKKMDAFIAIRCENNAFYHSDIPPESASHDR